MSDSGLSGRVELHHSPQSDKKAALFSAAARLGDEYLEQLATANLTVEQSEVAVLGLLRLWNKYTCGRLFLCKYRADSSGSV